MNTTQTQTARAIAHHTNNTVEAIELANNADLVSNVAGVVVFIATAFAAEGVAREARQEVKLVKAGEFNTYAVVVEVPRANG